MTKKREKYLQNTVYTALKGRLETLIKPIFSRFIGEKMIKTAK
jgi:hypothetical protein